MALGFDEVRLPEDVARDVVVRRTFSTLVTTSENGAEQRLQRWANVRRSYEVAFQVWDESRWNQLDDFFSARRGKLIGFRMVDPAYYMAGYVYAGLGQYAVGSPVAIGTGNGSNKVFQCSVTRGALSFVCKKIGTRPGAPCRAWVGGVETAATFNFNTGTVTFSTAPPNGAAVTVVFFYDIPARFDTDILEATFSALVVGRTASIPIVEIRLP